ncbi:NADP-dependent 3-hydroxy acid dehydrogenase YdfG [Herbihabitans rhizosphaerae]|uniref:NADP-dependent 3-hydroxy acid dehydrogenase YdfG n=1 Tax=Herbihabitans rhizosphaerae TaxID=1872711 RepID=A0A4Q7KML7_9PSEU|nr:SDR family oxidoreductase [Herbihabitans rhizosphaerae]RZS36831.1 NADP-dependent 3-hydroxy acid dehydrogenase YdfG [Herbihabitans rhizosphaerae]
MSVAIITGASRGLGLALAAGLGEAGWKLVVDGRDGAALNAAAATIDGEVTTVQGDVTVAAHRFALVEAADRLGGADLLVNNAGILGPSPQPSLAQYPLDVLRDVYEANVLAPLALTQLVLPGLRERSGALVNITSDAAREPYEGWGGYGSAKAALEQASNVLSAEEPGVRVWWVDPGDLRTRMHQDAFPGEDISDRPLPETVLPAFLRLLADKPVSGRVRLADLLVAP